MSECTELSTDRHGRVVIVREAERLRPLVCVGQGIGPQPEYRSSDGSQGQAGDAPPFRPLSSAERIPATTGQDTGTFSCDSPRLTAWGGRATPKYQFGNSLGGRSELHQRPVFQVDEDSETETFSTSAAAPSTSACSLLSRAASPDLAGSFVVGCFLRFAGEVHRSLSPHAGCIDRSPGGGPGRMYRGRR
jgi:hypothetical protein